MAGKPVGSSLRGTPTWVRSSPATPPPPPPPPALALLLSPSLFAVRHEGGREAGDTRGGSFGRPRCPSVCGFTSQLPSERFTGSPPSASASERRSRLVACSRAVLRGPGKRCAGRGGAGHPGAGGAGARGYGICLPAPGYPRCPGGVSRGECVCVMLTVCKT